MKIRFKYFPGGKTHALTMSYDDGVVQDRRLVELFNKYGIKGTFHLNSGYLGDEKKLPSDEVAELYRGHEISAHSLTHPFLESLPACEVAYEISEDRKNLEALAGYPVFGMSYPYGTYSRSLARQLRSLGIVYARTVNSTGKFYLPEDFMTWNPTCHHREGLLDRFEKFKKTYARPALMYVWGHAYELDQNLENNSWELMEEFCKRAGGDPDIWYATNIEIYEYVTAMRGLRFSADRTKVLNPSATDVIIDVDGEPVTVGAGETVTLCERK